jgi:hypothetical protein
LPPRRRSACARARTPASFNNGSFELGSADIGSFITLNGGDSTSITGWTVGGGVNSIDYIGT